jgi:antitoxin HicB
MSVYTFQIVIEKQSSDSGYTAYSPTLPGCFIRGVTLGDVQRDIRRAIHREIESLLERGEPIRRGEKLLQVEALEVVVSNLVLRR